MISLKPIAFDAPDSEKRVVIFIFEKNHFIALVGGWEQIGRSGFKNELDDLKEENVSLEMLFHNVSCE